MEPAINLLDYVFVVAPCPECGHSTRLPFSWATKGQEIDCPTCNHPYGLRFAGDLPLRIEQAFQKIQEGIREKGCWVEVHPYPSS